MEYPDEPPSYQATSTVKGPGVLITRLLGVNAAGFESGTLLQHVHYDFTLKDGFAQVANAPINFKAPTPSDLQLARPHPHAFFSPTALGWTVATLWPPNAQGIPDAQVRGLLDPQCLLRKGINGHLGGPSTESFHSGQPFPDKSQLPVERTPKRDGNWWSLCTCSLDSSLSLAISPEGFVDCVIGREAIQAFEKKRIEHPPLGAPPGKHAMLFQAWELVWRILDNILFRNETRRLKFNTSRMNKTISWDDTASKIFENLSFSIVENEFGPPPTLGENQELRLALIRAWIEVGILALHHKKEHELSVPKKGTAVQTNTSPADSKSDQTSRLFACLDLKDARETIGPLLGGNHFQEVERRSAWTAVGGKDRSRPGLKGVAALEEDYKTLGCTPKDAHTLVAFAFSRQIVTDPANGPSYLQALINIADNTDSEELSAVAISARESGMHSLLELSTAYNDIGLGLQGGTDRLPSDQITDEIIAEAYSAQLKNAQGSAIQHEKLRNALRILAAHRKSDLLQAVLASTAEVEKEPLTLEQAYMVLEGSSPDTDDAMLANLALLYSTDNPGKKADYEEAVKVIADARNSQLLHFYLQTGEIVSEAELMWKMSALQPASADRPVGLENIGNTCYLNSLLQYFFTIKTLRDVILRCGELLEAEDNIDKRVGGRLVSAQEVARSKKFVRLLADLFNNLISAPTNSIRPERELAYLALVTSQDEAEPSKEPSADSEPNGNQEQASASITESPADTKKDDPMDVDLPDGQNEATSKALEEKSPTPSVLGRKRTNEHLDQATDLARDLDIQSASGSDSYVLVSAREREGSTEANVGSPRDVASLEESAVTIEASPAYGPHLPSDQAPPLPPRKRHNSTKVHPEAGEMMFGRQHDVSECMDNVMFQIQAALNSDKLKEYCGSSTIVQDLFYGKTIQTLSFQDDFTERTKEEAFSYLLVDVAEEGRDIYDGLDAAFEEQMVEIEGRKAKRKLGLVHAPPILQIQLQRVQFDRENARVFKSNAYMAFKPQLKMDRYLMVDSNDTANQARQYETADRRRQLAEARAQASRLQSAETTQVMEHFRDIAAFTRSLAQTRNEPEFESFSVLENQASHIEQERQELKEKIAKLKGDIERTWQDGTKAEYELASVFMHRGEASFGHYWLHQRALFGQSDRYLKFNDAQVTDMAAEEVFADTTGQNHNPYWLTYVRKDLDLIESVHRQLT